MIESPLKKKSETRENDYIIITGIGFFFGLIVHDLSYLGGNLLRELLMFLSIQPISNFWITEASIFMGIIIFSIYFLKKISSLRIKKKVLLLYLGYTFFLMSLLVFLFKNYGFNFTPNKVIFEMVRYNQEILNNIFYKFLFFIFDIYTYVLTVVLIVKSNKANKLSFI